LYVDGRNWNEVEANGILKGTFDFAITSPPYATALPYIDTQRLSLVWLGLLDPISIRSADERLIGSREVTKSGLNSLHQDLNKNSSTLPEEVIEYCKLLQRHLSEKDGFRRQAVPALLYRYFSNMAYTFVTVKNAMRPGGIYALVVGTNRTTLGGTQFNIDTPIYLAEIAQHHGWSIDEMLPLETYKRYGLHVANAVQNETLIVMKNE
jgi:site-specific DNA-methyltransferase (cytosine-N4-specific)